MTKCQLPKVHTYLCLYVIVQSLSTNTVPKKKVRADQALSRGCAGPNNSQTKLDDYQGFIPKRILTSHRRSKSEIFKNQSPQKSKPKQQKIQQYCNTQVKPEPRNPSLFSAQVITFKKLDHLRAIWLSFYNHNARRFLYGIQGLKFLVVAKYFLHKSIVDSISENIIRIKNSKAKDLESFVAEITRDHGEFDWAIKMDLWKDLTPNDIYKKMPIDFQQALQLSTLIGLICSKGVDADQVMLFIRRHEELNKRVIKFLNSNPNLLPIPNCI